MSSPLDDLRRLEAEATPIGWEAGNGFVFDAEHTRLVCSFHDRQDAPFVAAMRNALPALLGGMDVLREIERDTMLMTATRDRARAALRALDTTGTTPASTEES